MRRALPMLLLALFLVWTAGLNAGAWQEDDIVGTLTKAPKALAGQEPLLTQCELGCAAADAVRAYAGTDIALVSGADLRGDLPRGLVTWRDVQGVFSADRPLSAGTVTPAQLYGLLEAAVSHLETDTLTERVAEASKTHAGFCQISGFAFRYDVSAPAGERVLSVTLEDGGTPDRTARDPVLTVAAPTELLDGSLGLPPVIHTPLEGTQAEALAAYLSSRTVLPEGDTDRIVMIGARDFPLVSMFPKGVLAAGAAVLMALLAFRRMRFNKIQDEYGNT